MQRDTAQPRNTSQVFAPSPQHVIPHPSGIPAPQRSAAPIQIHSIIHIVLNYSASDSPCALVQRQIFKEQLNTRVVLVAMEIWTDMDHIPISVMPLEMLRDFSKYRQQSIKRHADAVHLIT